MEPLDLGELPHDDDAVRRRRPPRRRPSRRLLLGIVALLVVAGLVTVADQRVRAAEDEALAACDERAYAAAVRADGLLRSMAQYVSPAFVGSDEEAAYRSAIYGLMADAAQDALPSLEAAREQCGAVDVLAVHRQHVAERGAVLAYLDARLDAVGEIAADGAVFFDRSEQRQQVSMRLARLREEAFPGRA